MTTNKEIANIFNDLAKIMELHQENKFKIRSYSNAYITLRKLDTPLTEMSDAELNGIKGVGKAISAKIREFIETGTLATLKKYQDQTPIGIQEMLRIKGFGPKKVYDVWKLLEIESVGELIYACNENRLIELKGFGKKTQEDLRKKLEYYQKSKNQYHYASLEKEADALLEWMQKKLATATISLTGAIRRHSPILEKIELVVATEEAIDALFSDEALVLQQKEANKYLAYSASETPILIYHCPPNAYGTQLFTTSSQAAFLDEFIKVSKVDLAKNIATEIAVFEQAGIPYVLPELRENGSILSKSIPTLLEEQDIKGVLHAHSTYSDGLASLKEMALESQRLGYQYLGITDHSKSAFYANGLKVDRLQQQWEEIDQLNASFNGTFKIFKGIESDILANGSLDYEEAILKQFDFIIASVHSNLKMDEEKATKRLIAAIENPYTTILGHPTGRLLLLDLDYQWIPYAMDKGVLIAVNPDAHSKEGIQDIHFGVLAARKGLLTKVGCLNTLSLEEFESKFKK